jgi:hypothetical protein
MTPAAATPRFYGDHFYRRRDDHGTASLFQRFDRRSAVLGHGDDLRD